MVDQKRAWFQQAVAIVYAFTPMTPTYTGARATSAMTLSGMGMSRRDVISPVNRNLRHLVPEWISVYCI